MDSASVAIAALLMLTTIAAPGCVRRTASVTSDPPGALVWVNDREIGRTPVETDFLFYGTYDVRLVHPEAESKLTVGSARPPIWDSIPLDFGAELLPIELHSQVRWHYELEPRDDEPASLLERARAFRTHIPTVPEVDGDE